MTHDTMSYVTGLVREHGVDCWWTMDVEQLLPPSMKASAHRCAHTLYQPTSPVCAYVCACACVCMCMRMRVCMCVYVRDCVRVLHTHGFVVMC